MNNLFIENSIGELIEQIKSGTLTPSALVAASLQNIKEFEKYKAFVVHADESLLERSKKEEQKGVAVEGLLSHIPMGVKDIYNTTDFPTQMGSPLWKDFTPGNDARAVFNLKREGAVTIGKTVTAEFAVHALEKTLNPFDVTKTPGTSSSGSAVAVTLGIVPIATGTQTAGSIVRPASFCGIYGCKPSFGLIPRTGMLKTTDSLDTLGFFSLYQKDLRGVFESMRVHGKNYPISDAALSDESRQHKPEGRPWRVGFARTHTWEHAPQYAKEAIEAYMKKLGARAGITVAEAALPAIAGEAHEIHNTIYNKALSYYFQTEYAHAEQISPIMQELITSGNKVSIDEYRKALAKQTELIYAMDEYFKDFDVLISLSTAGDAPPREMTELPDPALLWTLAHVPVVSAPVFRSPGNLPFGMQVVARKYNDKLLFEFLDHLESLEMIPQKAGYSVAP